MVTQLITRAVARLTPGLSAFSMCGRKPAGTANMRQLEIIDSASKSGSTHTLKGKIEFDDNPSTSGLPDTLEFKLQEEAAALQVRPVP